jgi:hypothetical protein
MVSVRFLIRWMDCTGTGEDGKCFRIVDRFGVTLKWCPRPASTPPLFDGVHYTGLRRFGNHFPKILIGFLSIQECLHPFRTFQDRPGTPAVFRAMVDLAGGSDDSWMEAKPIK